MNRTPRLSKSGIEYLDYSWGVFSGCHNLEQGICPVKACWAKSITKRFPNHYPNEFKPTFYSEALESPQHIKKPSRIGVGWVGDVIGYGWQYKAQIYETIRWCPQHTFLFLTKNPENLAKWSPFPDNCHVGFTATNRKMLVDGLMAIGSIKASKIYISFEPLLSRICDSEFGGLSIRTLGEEMIRAKISQVIIGQQTPIRPETTPKIEWIKEIVESADRAGVNIFLKDNLRPLPISVAWIGNEDKSWAFRHGELRQEMPK